MHPIFLMKFAIFVLFCSTCLVKGNDPTSQPTRQPTRQPTGQPTRQPTRQPSGQPSRQPTSEPSSQPTRQPSGQPSRQPTSEPSSQPTAKPTSQPSRQPTSEPSSQPSMQPSSLPTGQPTIKPSGTIPTSRPSSSPTLQMDARRAHVPFLTQYGAVFYSVTAVFVLILACIVYSKNSTVCECKYWSASMANKISHDQQVEILADRPTFVIKTKPAEDFVNTSTTTGTTATSTSSFIASFSGLLSAGRGKQMLVVRERDDVDERTDAFERKLIVSKAQDLYNAHRPLPQYLEKAIASDQHLESRSLTHSIELYSTLSSMEYDSEFVGK